MLIRVDRVVADSVARVVRADHDAVSGGEDRGAVVGDRVAFGQIVATDHIVVVIKDHTGVAVPPVSGSIGRRADQIPLDPVELSVKTTTPSMLAEITLPWPAVLPPITLLAALAWMRTPVPPLPRAVVPSGATPM